MIVSALYDSIKQKKMAATCVEKAQFSHKLDPRALGCTRL